MSTIVLEPMATAAQWTATAADGVTPSVALAMQDDPAVAAFGADGVSGRITATTAASGHMLTRTMPSVDIGPASELRLSIRGDRIAGGAGAPFYLELRVGSAAMPIDAAANTWHRYLPVDRADSWQTVVMGLDDLAPAVAAAVTQMRIRCLDASIPFTAHVDDVTAVRPELLADLDTALEQRLAGIQVGGATAGVVVRTSSQAPPAAPALDLVNVDVRYAPDRVHDVEIIRDHGLEGRLRVYRVGDPYDVTYAVMPIATSRDEQAALLQGAVARLRADDELVVLGERWQVQATWIMREGLTSQSAAQVPVLHYRIGAYAPVGAARPVRAVRTLDLKTEQLVAP